ncbi:hypothetical protein HII31_06560 [Pseudocercospora fuligena]|uniref:Uncharacterized protein n=1 Tax=Pseudocercospora fuligena TaxID=685502 RepID=A0A8H6RIL7_9PEZI|nr:hypothetical protein HII31_06560 [Pseudocercospora fuligena]
MSSNNQPKLPAPKPDYTYISTPASFGGRDLARGGSGSGGADTKFWNNQDKREVKGFVWKNM